MCSIRVAAVLPQDVEVFDFFADAAIESKVGEGTSGSVRRSCFLQLGKSESGRSVSVLSRRFVRNGLRDRAPSRAGPMRESDCACRAVMRAAPAPAD